MLAKRIIPCLDVVAGRTVKGTNFVDLRDAGDPVALAKKYEEEGADELVFLNIAASPENKASTIDLVRRIAAELTIPFTIGGGIESVEDAADFLSSGADKISINSAAVKNPKLIKDIAERYGSQCVVVAMDVQLVSGAYQIYISGGKIPTDKEAIQWALEAESLGAGELLVTSIDTDGTKSGFDLPLLKKIDEVVNIPLIASGGAGSIAHFEALFSQTDVSAGLAASIFHFGQVSIPTLKNQLKNGHIPIRL